MLQLQVSISSPEIFQVMGIPSFFVRILRIEGEFFILTGRTGTAKSIWLETETASGRVNQGQQLPSCCMGGQGTDP